MPDAIITGTGLGCIEDTEKFLANLVNNKEELLTPTSFIQSTHNTVSAQIALLLKCHNYNFTYVHRGLSFESALLDSLLQLDSGLVNTVLLGGMDEMTAGTFRIQQRLGHFKQKPVVNTSLLEDKTRGSIAGEGAAFFLLSINPGTKNYAKISGLDFFYKAEQEKVFERLGKFLDKSGKTAGEIDLLLLGMNGDPQFDSVYDSFRRHLFPKTHTGYFKHLCGEYFTSSAFGLWLAAKILHHQRIPEGISLKNPSSGNIRNILIYNHFRNTEHSFILVTTA
jgi:3-oxoacyl-(acyl-carrier-protein) synthase